MVRRKTISVIIIAGILSLILGAGSLAYYTDAERADNTITSGGIDIQLHEWAGTVDDEGNKVHFEDVTGVMPGTGVPKIVEIENVGENPAYVRIALTKEIVLMYGGTPNTDLVKLDLDTENWTYQDGFYYYNQALEPGKTTEPLFTTVTFDPAMGNMYQNSVAKIFVGAYATQVKNNGTSALAAKGWPAI
ncbi:MAG: SipW-dependent-type signal peptide-containing protein [Firmicutes bacterium]|nr:SipW-dependent-type signal peptide-containing protein [Bacillota bacterium]